MQSEITYPTKSHGRKCSKKKTHRKRKKSKEEIEFDKSAQLHQIGIKEEKVTGLCFKASFTLPSNNIDSNKCSVIGPVNVIYPHLWRNKEQ